MQLIDKPDAALRLARTIASDILLYNKDKIAEGLRNDSVFEDLADELKEAMELFENRVTPALRDQHNFVERAIVDVLIKSSAHLQTNVW